MIYSYESIRAIHLELTDRCNAGCPMCPRYVDGEVAPHIQNIQFYLDDIKSMFPADFVQQLNRINFCGNYGEPIVARDLIPIIKHFRSINPNMRIEVNTNASARRVEWWRELAQVMGSDESTSGVWFGLDGLEDTNHLYRRNTNWEVIMRNAKAFIGAGGIAHWNFIAFKHNEHQIEAARTLAHKMGFKHFNVKLTARFQTGNTYPVIVEGEHVYDLGLPTEEDYLRPQSIHPTTPRAHSTVSSQTMTEVTKIIEEYRKTGHIDAQLAKKAIEKPNIKCIAQQENSIYVSATGHVYPCCWISNGHTHGDSDIIMENDLIDITKRSIRDIVAGEEFQAVEDSWGDGSIRKCVNICTVVETSEDKASYGAEFVIHNRVDQDGS